MKRFTEHVKKYQVFYKNFWVYHIFGDVMAIPDYAEARKRFIYAAAEFCLVQSLAFIQFTINGSLKREEYIYIISSVSRRMEHSARLRTKLMERLNAFNAAGAGGLLLMIIS